MYSHVCMWRDFNGWWHGRHFEQNDSDGNPNLLGANRNDDGRWLNAFWDNPDNTWNRDNGFAFAVSQLPSFLPRHFVFLGGGVLFIPSNVEGFNELVMPTAKITPDHVHFFRKSDILFILKRLCFPENLQENLDGVYFSHREAHIRQFFRLDQKGRGGNRFYALNK